MRTNYKAIIENRVKSISKLTGIPLNRAEAEKVGAPKYLAVDSYNGYLLIEVDVSSGAESCFSFRNDKRLTAAAFVEVLDAMIFGMEYEKNLW